MSRISMDGVSMELDERQKEEFGYLVYEKLGWLEKIMHDAQLPRDDEYARYWARRFATYRTLVNAGLLFEEFPDQSDVEAIQLAATKERTS